MSQWYLSYGGQDVAGFSAKRRQQGRTKKDERPTSNEVRHEVKPALNPTSLGLAQPNLRNLLVAEVRTNPKQSLAN